MLKKLFASLLTVLALSLITTGLSSVEASTKIVKHSVNTTKVNHTLNDKNIVVAIHNHNKVESSTIIQPQVLKNGKWRNLDWYDVEFISKNKKLYVKHSVKSFFENKRGTYRYKVEAQIGNGKKIQTVVSYSKRFVIK